MPQGLPRALSFLPSPRNTGPGGASSASRPSCLERTPLVPARLPPQGYWLVPGTEPVPAPSILPSEGCPLLCPGSWVHPNPGCLTPRAPSAIRLQQVLGPKVKEMGGAHLGAPGRAGGWGAKSAPRRARASSPGCSSGEIEEGSGVSPALEPRGGPQPRQGWWLENWSEALWAKLSGCRTTWASGCSSGAFLRGLPGS